MGLLYGGAHFLASFEIKIICSIAKFDGTRD